MNGNFSARRLKNKKGGFACFAAAAAIAAFFHTGCASRAALEVRESARISAESMRLAEIEWVESDRFDFDCPGMMEEFMATEGEWEIRDGSLCAISGDRHRVILLKEGVSGPVRIEAEVTNYASAGLSCDIKLLLGATEDDFNAGYALTSGAYWNNCSVLYKQGDPIAYTSWSPIESGKKNRVVVEYNNGHLRYELNDEIVLQAWDESPLHLDGEGWLGMHTWNTFMCVGTVVIYEGKNR